MAEQEEKKGGWFRNIASVFVEMPPEPETPITTSAQTGNTTGFVGKNPTPIYSSMVPVNADTQFIEDLRNRFKKIIADKNQAGFDFYEFSMMLLRTSNNPSVEHFKTAYEGAKLMNPNCNQKFLLDSATFYKNELSSAFQTTAQAGEQKKGTLNTEKANEQKQLNTDIADIEKQLAQLRQQIAQLEQAQSEKTTALQGIDARFQEKFVDIEQKIAATVAAKDSVLSEITLIENGIKQYLS